MRDSRRRRTNANVADESVVDARSVRQEEAAARAEIVEEEQFLLLHIAGVRRRAAT